ncbi:MAG TPA: sulfite exporter TauE/SafE family protein [Pseudorhodoplanes sp.]|nr:sulfite exporter TauE/SafE family protein [Pseudorhodoplanes sp.]
MLLGVPANELAWLVIAIMIGALVTGLLAGLFGIGGGAVVVPVLYEVFRVVGVPEEVRMQLCVGTSLAVMAPTTVGSYRAHLAKGAVVAGVLRRWIVPTVIGVGAGALIALVAPSSVFRGAFAVIGTAIALKMLAGRDDWRLGTELPGQPLLGIYGFLIGLASSLMGISGGSLSTIVLTLYGKTMHQAVATSAGLTVPISIAGALGYMLAGLPQQPLMPPFSIGFVSLIGFALMAPLSTFVAGFGARLAHGLGKRTLEVAFGLYLLAMSIRFAASLIG